MFVVRWRSGSARRDRERKVRSHRAGFANRMPLLIGDCYVHTHEYIWRSRLGLSTPRTSPGVSADHHVGGLKAPGNLNALAYSCILDPGYERLNALYIDEDYLNEKRRQSSLSSSRCV